MKIIFILFFLLLSSTVLCAQDPAADTIVPSKGNIEQQLREIRKRQILLHSDSTKNDNVPKKTALVDTTKKNRYNDLLDDPACSCPRRPAGPPCTGRPPCSA